MKVPPKRKGNPVAPLELPMSTVASMKVPPKRKGNLKNLLSLVRVIGTLNESPSEKEGKCVNTRIFGTGTIPSMKVPTKK